MINSLRNLLFDHIKTSILLVSIFFIPVFGQSQQITFCGKPIPLSNDNVSKQLLEVMKRYLPTVNAPMLKAQIRDYLPFISRKLAEYNLPQDLKYLPIVESHFQLLTSKAGAKGFWQFMEATAGDYNLKIDQYQDEREDFEKSTDAACRLLRDYHKQLTRTWNTADWALVCAAYNFGSGNITNAVKRFGTTDYFSMSLNPETALYVYKIIAVKELIERPELYVGKLNSSLFNVKAADKAVAKKEIKIDIEEAKKIEEELSLQTSFSELVVNEISEEEAENAAIEIIKYNYVEGTITSEINPSDFKDGMLLRVNLNREMKYKGGWNAKGTLITSKCYLIDDRIFFDMGRRFELVFPDERRALKKGVPIAKIKKGLIVTIRTEI